MRPAFARCTDCHADDHGGQLKAAANKGECSACHRVAGWTPSTFDSAAHARTRLALDGRHQEVDLRRLPRYHAHQPAAAAGTTVALGKANFLFKVNEVDCAACHVDPHQGRFAARGARPRSAGCLACHGTRVVPALQHHGGGARGVRLRARGGSSGHALLGLPQGAHPAGGREAILARARRRHLGRAAARGEGGAASRATPTRMAPSSTHGTRRAAAPPATRWRPSRRRRSSTTTPTPRSRSRARTRRSRAASATCGTRRAPTRRCWSTGRSPDAVRRATARRSR